MQYINETNEIIKIPETVCLIPSIPILKYDTLRYPSVDNAIK